MGRSSQCNISNKCMNIFICFCPSLQGTIQAELLITTKSLSLDHSTKVFYIFFPHSSPCHTVSLFYSQFPMLTLLLTSPAASSACRFSPSSPCVDMLSLIYSIVSDTSLLSTVNSQHIYLDQSSTELSSRRYLTSPLHSVFV